MPASRALALLCAADLVVALDGMVVMVALPAIAAPRIIVRAGARTTATASLVVTAAAFAYLATVPDEGGHAVVLLPALLPAGFTFATAFVPLTSQGMTGVREGRRDWRRGCSRRRRTSAARSC